MVFKMTQQRTAIYYADPKTGKEPAQEWLDSLRDRIGQARIYARIERAEKGNFGDHHTVSDGVVEMRIDVGPGYRVYFAFDGAEVILLLVGGDKSTQDRDIALAKKYWSAHKAETKKGK
jgi:putative addiction module killer protein